MIDLKKTLWYCITLKHILTQSIECHVRLSVCEQVYSLKNYFINTLLSQAYAGAPYWSHGLWPRSWSHCHQISGHSSDDEREKTSRVTLQMNRHEQFQIDQSTHRLNYLEYIGQRGISLSGSYQQGYSTAYNTQSHIKVVCNGYILTHILN